MSEQKDTLLVLGDPKLEQVSVAVEDFSCKDVQLLPRQLSEQLRRFHSHHQFGRSLSAIQIGCNQRCFLLTLPEGEFVLFNPKVTWKSATMFSIWEECPSTPTMMYAVKRHCSLSIEFQDAHGQTHEWRNLGPYISALIQHEMDHLEGIMSVLKVANQNFIVPRQLYKLRQEFFNDKADASMFNLTNLKWLQALSIWLAIF